MVVDRTVQPGTVLPPGPPLPSLAQLAVSAWRPNVWLRHCAARYGDAFTLRVAGVGTIVVFTGAEATRAIISGDGRVFHASAINQVELSPLVGHSSAFTLDEDAHVRVRKLLAPFFGRRQVHAMAETATALTRDEVASWPRGTPFTLRQRLQDLVLRLMLRTTFGAAPTPGEDDRLAGDVTELLDAGQLVLPVVALRRHLGNRSPWTRFVRARERIDTLIYELIRRRCTTPETGGDDALSQLAATSEKDGSAIQEREVRDHLVTILIAGIETTSTALAWSLYELARHPCAQRRVVAERGRGESKYLTAVVKESLRVHPPVPMGPIPMLTEPTHIGNYRLAAGTYVTVGTVAIHRDARTYAEPDSFRPERFLGSAPSPDRYLPFGWGPHRCIGASLAALEMERVLGVVLDAVELAPADARPEPGRLRYVTCAPGRAVRVVARPRAGVPATQRAEDG